MYYDYFNLKEHPFRLTCEAKFFYLSPEHTHANAMMEFALIKRQGLMLLTGEVGTGKTMLIQHFLSRINDAQYRIARVNLPQVSGPELFQMILGEISDDGGRLPDNINTLQREITQRIEALHAAKQHCIIIIDDALNLENDVLMRLFEISQHRINNERICTIYLVGINRLRESQDDASLNEFIATINTRYHLGPLPLADIRKYIYHRLAVAGDHQSIQMDKEIFGIIETYTGGRPRLINVLVDHILTYAYLEDIRKITSKVVDAAIADLQWLPFGANYAEEQPKKEQAMQEERRHSFKIIIRKDGKIQGEYHIRKKRITLGRHRENDLRIDDPLISRQHAQIIQQGRTTYFRDLGSTNGSFVNNKRVDIAPLDVGTEVKVGNYVLTFTRSSKDNTSSRSSSSNMLKMASQRN